jgi:hypothetical protein
MAFAAKRTPAKLARMPTESAVAIIAAIRDNVRAFPFNGGRNLGRSAWL